MVRRLNQKNYGFTLVETILAAVILCAAVLAVGGLSTRALRNTQLNRQYEVAAQVADKQLTIIDYLGISEFLRTQETEGTLDASGTEYLWTLITEQEQDRNGLYNVKLTVSWLAGAIPHSVSLDTRLKATVLSLELPAEGAQGI